LRQNAIAPRETPHVLEAVLHEGYVPQAQHCVLIAPNHEISEGFQIECLA